MKGYAQRMAKLAREAYATPGAMDPLEMMDAAWEDANGRLPHEEGYIDPLTTLPARKRSRARKTAQTKPRRRKAA